MLHLWEQIIASYIQIYKLYIYIYIYISSIESSVVLVIIILLHLNTAWRKKSYPHCWNNYTNCLHDFFCHTMYIASVNVAYKFCSLFLMDNVCRPSNISRSVQQISSNFTYYPCLARFSFPSTNHYPSVLWHCWLGQSFIWPVKSSPKWPIMCRWGR